MKTSLFRAALGLVLVLGMISMVGAGTLDVPTKYDLSSSQKTTIVQWMNSSSQAELTAARLSSTAVKKILSIQATGGFTSWDHLWTTTSVGSNTVVKLVIIHLGMYQNPYDLYKTRPPIRVRTQDRQAIINWANSASLNSMIAIGITSSGQTKLTTLRPFTSWKHLLAVISEGDIVKIGIKVGSARYVSGSTAIELISGIGTSYGSRFRALKINSTQQLLYSSVWPEWRSELASQVNLGQGFIDRWAKRADLNRISGIGEQYGDLLAYSGVNTVPDLVGKNPTTLRNTMIEMKTRYNLTNTVPSLTTVTGWINKAGTLPKMLEGF